MLNIQDNKDLKSKRVLLRVDFNIALDKDGVVLKQEDLRLVRTLPTIQFLQKAGAKIILLSHIGRERDETLLPVVQYINQNLGIFVNFVPEIIGENASREVNEMEDGDIIMLENLRRDVREEENDENFAKEIASLGDIYVNDAFGVSHRSHASLVGVPKFLPSYAGLLMQDEIRHLSFEEEKHPFLVILGGAKLETKMPLIEKYLEDADEVFVGGALANEIFKSKGYEIGKSLDGGYVVSQQTLKNSKLIYPKDIVARSGSTERMCRENEAGPDEIIVDVGEESLKELIEKTKSARRILWNGPLGLSDSLLVDGTRKLLNVLAYQLIPQGPTLRTGGGVEIIIGGGDTVAQVQELELIDKFIFVSTGGGAMLEFLEKGTLVGIEALEKI